MKKPFFCSWSGGKDSCLALHHTIKGGAQPLSLVTMCIEDGQRTRSHGLSIEVIKAQSASLDIPCKFANTSWEKYEDNFVKMATVEKEAGARVGVFGDIDFEDNKAWELSVCKQAGIEAYLPLWKKSRQALLDEFLELGFKAIIIAIDRTKLDSSVLGQTLSAGLVKEFRKQGIDPCGEEGEYHTVVVDGPIFSNPLEFKLGSLHIVDNRSFQDVLVNQ